MSVSSPASSPASPRLAVRRAGRRTWFRRGAWLVGAGVSVLVIAWGFRDDAISPAAPEPVPPLIAEKTRQTVRKDGKRLWQFDADKIELSPDGSQTFAHNVSNGILFRDDKPFIFLSARLVHLENNSNNVEASGGVTAKGENRFAVSSRIVKWNYAQKKLSCPSNVKANLREFTFDAPRLSYNWETSVLMCDSPVELKAQGVRLKGTRLKASTKTHLLELGGSELSFDVRKARPNKWKDLLSLR